MWLLSVSDCNITKFLNRILGLEVHKQNSLFQYFTDNFDYLIEKDKKDGKYDMGILGKQHFFWWGGTLSCVDLLRWQPSICFLSDLAPGNDQIYEETHEKFLTAGNPQDGQVILYKVRLFKEVCMKVEDTPSWTDSLMMRLLQTSSLTAESSENMPKAKEFHAWHMLSRSPRATFIFDGLCNGN